MSDSLQSNSNDSAVVAKPVTSHLPEHIAIIMDGNNRWAKNRDNSAESGHREGAKAARTVVNYCAQKGVRYLTLFAFSSENWLRPEKEVRVLMALFLSILKRNEVNKIHKNNIKLCFIGNRTGFSPTMQKLMLAAEKLTQNNTGLLVMVAADYGGRWDIINATRNIAKQVKSGTLETDDIDAKLFQQHLCGGDVPMPDLCIRTGGERRISNFLLWQFAYTELYFTEIFWPDFDEHELDLALADYSQRQRRFGMISEQVEVE